jgi:hypothetical protein
VVRKVQFLGRVLPDTVKLSIQMPDLKWKWEEENLELAFHVKIGNSVINAECEIEKLDPAYLAELHKRASDLARASVNIIAFATGVGLSAIIDTIIGPDGMPLEIHWFDSAIPPLCTAFSLDPSTHADFDAVYKIILKEPQLYRALNDLVETISVSHVSCVNCGRVIDSIRRMITPATKGSPAKAWQAMHSALNVSQSYQEWISDNSTGPRHGDPEFVPGNISMEMTHRTWTIMNSFLEFRKRGDTPLTAPEFPLLIPSLDDHDR